MEAPFDGLLYIVEYFAKSEGGGKMEEEICILILHTSSPGTLYHTKAEPHNCIFIRSKYFQVFKHLTSW